jgi:hypothetical protein
MSSLTSRALLLALLLLGSGRRLAAQSGDDMGQGEAAIAVRSDVKLAIKGTGGTPSERLTKLGQAVSDQMGEIRTCYRKLVETSPEVNGALRLRIGLTEGKPPLLEVLDQSSTSPQLAKCVTHVLTIAKYPDVGRPAAAFLTLGFDNSRAKGQAAMVERSAQLGHAQVHTTPDGQHETSWATDAGEVRFTIRVPSSVPDADLDRVLRGFQAGYAAFLDCRRKCEKGGVSPEGDIEATLDIDAKGKQRVKIVSVTVKHERAPGCADRSFKRLAFDKPTVAPLSAQLSVHFAP